jgi:hypothetical protein
MRRMEMMRLSTVLALGAISGANFCLCELHDCPPTHFQPEREPLQARKPSAMSPLTGTTCM